MSKIKKRIKKAYITLLEERKVISSITVKELSELADINRSTFYLHYKDIYAIANDVENEIMDQIFPNEEINTVDDVHNLILFCIKYLIENQEELYIYVKSPDTQYSIDKFKRKIFNILTESNFSNKYNSESFRINLNFYLEGLFMNVTNSIKTNEFETLNKYCLIWFDKLFL